MPSPRKPKAVSAVKKPKAKASTAKAKAAPKPRGLPKLSLPRVCADAAADKKAEDIVILDMRGLSSFTDYFVICSGTSDPQLKAIANSIRSEVSEKLNQRPIYEDGFPASQWVILDYGDVLVHVFHKEKRGYYGLEDLWGDAKKIPYSEK